EPAQQKAKAKAKASDGAGPRPGAATASDDAGLPGGLEAPPADDLEEPAAETGDGKEKAAEAGDGQEKAAEAADGKEKPAPKAPKVAGKASGSNFAGRTPPNTPPYSTRFQCCKKTWVEKIHPQIKPGHYQKSQVHWWKYVLANMDLAVCVTEQEIQTRVDELVGLYVVPYEQKLHTGP
ncbi:pol, partial [Symbiodinium necroappetens]